MRKFDITGMSCAACSARVEKAVSGVDGVKSCAVNLLTNSMTVEGTADEASIIKAVHDAGYGVAVNMAEKKENNTLKDKDTPLLIKRLLSSLVFLFVLMYVSMGHIMWGFPLPEFLSNNPIAIGLTQLLLSTGVLVINQKFFINGFKGLVKGSPNMDTLVALGSSAAFVYSVYELFAMTVTNKHTHLHNLYFESAAMILTLITVGKMLEARSKGKTTDALRSLMSLSPKTATVLRDQKEIIVPVAEVKVGDIFVVKAGESIPVDGLVVEGNSAVDESALTGESIPVDKGEKDNVRAATISKSGYLKCKATKVGEDTTFAKIITLVSDAAASKAPIARIADKVSGVFVPIVLIIAVITAVVWLICGQNFGYTLARGISVLVISCPCALGLATPVAIMVGSGVGAKKGILFKTAADLEKAGKTDIVVLDKTGTITKGRPQVTDIISEDKEGLLHLAASLEKKSEHPLSIAVTEKAEQEGISLTEVSDFAVHPGNGVTAKLDGKVLAGGNLRFIGDFCAVGEELKSQAADLSSKGKTPLFFSYDKEFLGIIAVADTVKEDSIDAISTLKKMGIKTIMLTGDNIGTAKSVGESVGIDEIIADVLPDQKAKVIETLKNQGKVMMVGDGINDAPSLAVADTGVAVLSGTDIAGEAADIILMNSHLSDVPVAVNLSRAVLKNIKQNLFWAFIYNTLGIPLAAGAFVSLLGWELSPMFGAAAMSLSSVCVVLNALRLNLIKTSPVQKGKKEKMIMQKTIKIEGMMCPHCENRVKTILEEIKEVESAEVSHKDGTAIVTLTAKTDDNTFKKIIEDAGYKVVSII